MRTTEDDFKEELKALLRKYSAIISAADHWQGYAECGSDVRMTVEFPYPHNDLDLGSYFAGDSE